MKKYNNNKINYLNLKIGYFNNICNIGGAKEIELHSKDIKQGEHIKNKFTNYYDNITPKFTWTDVPENTKSLLLLCYDEDAVKTARKVWIHWFVYDIDPKTNTLERDKYMVGKNSNGYNKYDGPRPPKGSGEHRYRFVIYALDSNPEFDKNKIYEYEEVDEKINENIISKSEIIGTYIKT